MENLRVLNLQNTRIVSLPSSLRKLKYLKVLNLNDCTSLPKPPPEIGELVSLEVLDIRGTGVEIIHKPFLHKWRYRSVDGHIRKTIFGEPSSGTWEPFPTIRRLSRLKRLLVSFNDFGNSNFSRDVIGFCEAISDISTTLEELVIDVDSRKIFCNRVINVVRDSVATMPRLAILKFLFNDDVVEVIKVVAGNKKTYFPQVGDLASFFKRINDHDSTSFGVYVGCSISSNKIPNINQYQRTLKICNAQGPNPAPIVTEVLSRCDSFELVNHYDLEHVSQFGTASFNGVEGCLIQGCNNIGAIVDGNCIMDNSPMLPNLQELYMKKLRVLESIWKGPWKAGSLFNLRTLLIEECIGIEELFTHSVISSSNLPNLSKLILIELRNLRRICDNVASEWPALEELEIKGCPSLTELPFNIDSALKLGCIKASQSWWESLIWQDPNVKRRLDQLYHPL